MLLSIYLFACANKNRIAVSIFLLTAMVIHNSVGAQSNAPRVTPETIARYLSQDIFLSPGIGFKQVQLGHAFVQVAQVWGTPNKGFEDTETGSKVVWVYLAKDSTISLTGGSSVKAIRVEGSFNSPFASSEGAHFGMTPHQVISIYGPPETNDDLTNISYPSKGIEFSFEHGGLKWMRVFSPKS